MAAKDATGHSRKEPIPPPSNKPPTSWEDFRTWFWTGSNGNKLIKYLNEADATDYIRRESFNNRPEIYCIVLNGVKISSKTDKIQWKLCKVGFTHRNTQVGTSNRMEQVKKKINVKYGSDAKPTVIFKLPIGAVDTRPYSETETWTREAMGLPIKKELAEKMGLAFPTEWVLTTQDFIDEVKSKTKAEGIDFFKSTKFKKYNPPTWAVVDANGQVTHVPVL